MFIKANRVSDFKTSRAKLMRGYDRGLSPFLRYEWGRELMVDVKQEQGGFRVTQIDPQSPLTRLTAPGNLALTGSLEVGDRIVAMNGVPAPRLGSIQSPSCGAHDRCEISVFDQRTHQTVSWDLHFSSLSHPVQRAPREIDRDGKLFALVVQPTLATESCSAMATAMTETANDIVSHLALEIDRERLELIQLFDETASAEKILCTIDSLPVNGSDSILVYIVGEDAYDPRFATSDSSHGQFFRIPDGDLLRRTIWDHLDSTPARLRALISDTSHTPSTQQLNRVRAWNVAETHRSIYETAYRDLSAPSNLEWLFLGHRGRIDINALPRNRASLVSERFSGWFTHCFFASVLRHDEWRSVSTEMQSTLEDFFTKKRPMLCSDTDSMPGRDRLQWMRAQDVVMPEIHLSVTRDKVFAAQTHKCN